MTEYTYQVESSKSINVPDYDSTIGIQPASYIIYKDGSTIKAINGTTGVVDYSSTVFETVFNSTISAVNSGATIVIKEMTVTPAFAMTVTKSVNIKGEGNVIFNWNKPSQDLFVFNGSLLSITMLTADVTINANSIAVAAIGNIINGDLLIIYDDTKWNPEAYPAWKTGELHEISSISGNTITIADSTISAFTIAQNGSVKLIRPITVTIDGITINGADQSGGYYGMSLKYNKNSIIRNGKFQNNGLHAIEIINSYNTTVENNIIGDSIMAGYGYGVVSGNATAYITIINNYFYNCRHCVANGGDGTIGQPRDITLIANTFANSTGIGAVLDAHPIVESYYIYNNVIYSPSNQYAIFSGAKITKFIGNTVVGGLGTGVNSTTPFPIIEISNNTFINTVQMFLNEEILKIPNVIIIKDNVITGNITRIVHMHNVTQFVISGNQFDSTLTTGGGIVINLSTCSNGIISNNFIKNAYNTGIILLYVDHTIISNNIIKDYNVVASSQDAICLNNCTYNTVTGNVAISSSVNSYGITEIGISDYNRFLDNDVSGVVTAAKRIVKTGVNSKAWKNTGYLTENNVLSVTFYIDSMGIKIVQIPHGLAITPNIQDCHLALIKNTNVVDWAYNLLIVDSVDATNVVAKINISTASETGGATAKLALGICHP